MPRQTPEGPEAIPKYPRGSSGTQPFPMACVRSGQRHQPPRPLTRPVSLWHLASGSQPGGLQALRQSDPALSGRRSKRSQGCGCSSMAEQKLPKLTTGVRFPSPAPSLKTLWSNPRVLAGASPKGARRWFDSPHPLHSLPNPQTPIQTLTTAAAGAPRCRRPWIACRRRGCRSPVRAPRGSSRSRRRSDARCR